MPDDVVVVFANTGKEREETLRFVYECGVRWGVDIAWVEFTRRSGPADGRYQRVGFNSASRNGEPLAALIAAKQFTPNSAMRFCTEDAKVNTIRHYLETERGLTGGKKVIGLRHDEGRRLLKMAPLHHHFEKSGWRETQVVVRFWIITMMLVLFGLSTLKLR